MSFSSDVKKELSLKTGRAVHCRLAETAAILMFCGVTEHGKDSFSGDGGLPDEAAGMEEPVIYTDHGYSADKYVLLLHSLFHAGSDKIRVEEKTKDRRRIFCVRITDDALARDVLAVMNQIKAADGSDDAGELLRRRCCRRAFLRGAFLAAGSISDPDRSYHFEIVCQSSGQGIFVRNLIKSLGPEARIIQRRKKYVVYVKESSDISDLLGLMGADVSLLSFENTRVVRDVRGSVNRQVNCETANIGKTAAAAARQIEDIELIRNTPGYSKLPDRLDEVAVIRLQYPAATFAEIGRMLDPPVGKSGVNHRLRRISMIAEDIRKKQGGSFQDG